MSATKVFLSYSHRDSAVARRVAEALRAAGSKSGQTVTTYLDQDVQAGSDFRRIVQENMRSSDAVVVIATTPETGLPDGSRTRPEWRRRSASL